MNRTWRYSLDFQILLRIVLNYDAPDNFQQE
jgi:hypothetical protein